MLGGPRESPEVRFGKMSKVAHCNWERELRAPIEQIPKDKKPPEELRRLTLAGFLGRAKLVEDPRAMDHEQGRLLKAGGLDLSGFASGSVTCGLYMQELFAFMERYDKKKARARFLN